MKIMMVQNLKFCRVNGYTIVFRLGQKENYLSDIKIIREPYGALFYKNLNIEDVMDEYNIIIDKHHVVQGPKNVAFTGNAIIKLKLFNKHDFKCFKRLKKKRNGVTLLNYDNIQKIVTFQVPHFSRYTLENGEEDDDEIEVQRETKKSGIEDYSPTKRPPLHAITSKESISLRLSRTMLKYMTGSNNHLLPFQQETDYLRRYEEPTFEDIKTSSSSSFLNQSPSSLLMKAAFYRDLHDKGSQHKTTFMPLSLPMDLSKNENLELKPPRQMDTKLTHLPYTEGNITGAKFLISHDISMPDYSFLKYRISEFTDNKKRLKSFKPCWTPTNQIILPSYAINIASPSKGLANSILFQPPHTIASVSFCDVDHPILPDQDILFSAFQRAINAIYKFCEQLDANYADVSDIKMVTLNISDPDRATQFLREMRECAYEFDLIEQKMSTSPTSDASKSYTRIWDLIVALWGVPDALDIGFDLDYETLEARKSSLIKWCIAYSPQQEISSTLFETFSTDLNLGTLCERLCDTRNYMSALLMAQSQSNQTKSWHPFTNSPISDHCSTTGVTRIFEILQKTSDGQLHYSQKNGSFEKLLYAADLEETNDDFAGANMVNIKTPYLNSCDDWVQAFGLQLAYPGDEMDSKTPSRFVKIEDSLNNYENAIGLQPLTLFSPGRKIQKDYTPFLLLPEQKANFRYPLINGPPPTDNDFEMGENDFSTPLTEFSSLDICFHILRYFCRPGIYTLQNVLSAYNYGTSAFTWRRVLNSLNSFMVALYFLGTCGINYRDQDVRLITHLRNELIQDCVNYFDFSPSNDNTDVQSFHWVLLWLMTFVFPINSNEPQCRYKELHARIKDDIVNYVMRDKSIIDIFDNNYIQQLGYPESCLIEAQLTIARNRKDVLSEFTSLVKLQKFDEAKSLYMDTIGPCFVKQGSFDLHSLCLNTLDAYPSQDRSLQWKSFSKLSKEFENLIHTNPLTSPETFMKSFTHFANLVKAYKMETTHQKCAISIMVHEALNELSRFMNCYNELSPEKIEDLKNSLRSDEISEFFSFVTKSQAFDPLFKKESSEIIDNITNTFVLLDAN